MRDGLRLVLAGDVMTGRGIDQVLPRPGDPTLHEEHVDDARTYVRLAERVSGPVPRPVGPTWPWGVALEAMDAAAADARVMNLETSVTSSDTPDLGKPVNYRMSPANLDVLRVARVDVWALANNHVLDYGRPGLRETLAVLDAGGVRGCGAGATDVEAWRPLRVPRARVTVLSVADASSGVPPSWQAGPDRPGVALLPGLTDAAADAVAHRLQEEAEPGDVLVVSVHWGSNWGYAVPSDQRRFAHRLLDAGVHVVHGHSSHHPRPVEVHRGRLVLHGCGDLVDDYEGIGGYAAFRDDLRVLWVADVEAGTGALTGLRLVPLRARRLRLEHAAAEDVEWLRATLTREGRSLGTRVEPGDGGLALRW